MILIPEKVTSQRNLPHNTLRGHGCKPTKLEAGKYCHWGSVAWVEELHATDILSLTEASRLLDVLCNNSTWGPFERQVRSEIWQTPLLEAKHVPRFSSDEEISATES